MPAQNTSARPVIAARGGSRSAADISATAPSTWEKEAPNILSADSSGDRVVPYTSVPSARPLTVDAATCADPTVKSGVNSGSASPVTAGPVRR